MKISACYIVKNEKEKLSESIKSIKSYVDEVIVVDTGSMDRTLDIGEKSCCKFFEYEWRDDFSEARNYSLSKASGDWIIFLDADEYIEEESAKKMIHSIKLCNEKTDVDTITCLMIHIDEERNEVIGKNPIIRIFRNNRNIRYSGRIHEVLTKKDSDLISIFVEDLVIIHTGYSKAALREKLARNLKNLLEEVKYGKSDAMTYYYICGCHAGLGNGQAAIKYANLAFESEIKNNKEIDNSISYKLYIIILKSMIEMGNKYSISQVREVLDKAKKRYWNHPEIVRYEAITLLKEKRIREALETFLLTIELNNKMSTHENNDFQTYYMETLNTIGSLFAYLNQEEKAIEYFLMVLKQNKFYEESLLRMLRLLLKENDEEIISFLNSIYNINSFDDIKFLIKSIKKIKMPIALSYYAKIWNTIYEMQDESIIEAMYALEQYEEVTDTVLTLAEEHKNNALLPYVIASIILGGLGEDYKRRLKDIDVNASVALELISVGDYSSHINDETKNNVLLAIEIIFSYADFCKWDKFMENAFKVINSDSLFFLIDRFISFGKIEYAKEYYSKLSINLEDKELKKKCLFIAGFCAYRLRKYSEAIVFFEKGVELGYDDYEIKECIEIIFEKCNDENLRQGINDILNNLRIAPEKGIKLNVGCGRNIKSDWINLDLVDGEGVDVVADLEICKELKLPFKENSVDQILANHVIEHIKNSMPMMEELYRISKPGATAVFRCPYGSSDDAFEDPTHLRQYFINSFGYFSQPFYWRADYGYRGDWKVEEIKLLITDNRFSTLSNDELLEAVNSRRNFVSEMTVILTAIKPIRNPEKELQDKPLISYEFTSN